MPRVLTKLACAVGAIIAGVGFAEITARIALGIDPPHAREDAVAVAARMSGMSWSGRPNGAAALADEASYKVVPFYGFDWADSDKWFDGDVSYFDSPESEASYDILVCGGSVAGGFCSHAGAKLKALLEHDPAFQGRQVHVMNYCRGAFRQPQLLHMLEYGLSLGLKPDVVIEMDGFNEVALGLDNAARGIHPAMPASFIWPLLVNKTPITPSSIDALASMRREQLSARALVGQADELGLFHSAVASRVVGGLVHDSYARFATASGEYQKLQTAGDTLSYAVGPTFETDDDAVLDTCARIWMESSISMNAVCRAQGIRYVHFLQPTLHDEGSKPVTDEERQKGAEPQTWARGAKLGYPKLRAASIDLEAARVQFVDLSQAFANERATLYYDICHFTPAGYEILVGTVADTLRQAPSVPKPKGGKGGKGRKHQADK